MSTLSAHQFFIVGFSGMDLPCEAQTLIKNHPLGGVILFRHNIESLEQVVSLNAAIIDANQSTPPLISVDQEGGRVARLRGICTDIPPLLSLQEQFKHDDHLAYRLGAMQARELIALGFHLNFAPVCDVLNHNENQVIGDRAFSQNPEKAALWASSYIKGLQGAGMAACAKHFPGHGRTAVDSHLALPVIDAITMDDMNNTELIPFKAAINADVATIMTAHIITKCLDEKPATLSAKTLDGILRHKLSFNNVVISDDLDMKALADHYALEEILTEGVLAGVDMFIIGNNFAKSIEAIEILDRLINTSQAIKNKVLASQKRLSALRSRYIGKPLAPNLLEAKNIVRSKPHMDLFS